MMRAVDVGVGWFKITISHHCRHGALNIMIRQGLTCVFVLWIGMDPGVPVLLLMQPLVCKLGQISSSPGFTWNALQLLAFMKPL